MIPLEYNKEDFINMQEKCSSDYLSTTSSLLSESFRNRIVGVLDISKLIEQDIIPIYRMILSSEENIKRTGFSKSENQNIVEGYQKLKFIQEATNMNVFGIIWDNLGKIKRCA